ncbi:MAG: hypothetical protein Q8922_12905 [Bacteroidota bacterium]|nr:hypothetical protein [Bacteroidota bacterium]MDP4234468.1 hypothetical protein [Bacteroidota bacterium]MDP4244184.1 hypothetical protein [Bacteroidota bacterium]MDP4288825.1 hypothetical protein [Bacteroidota bacterium]
MVTKRLIALSVFVAFALTSASSLHAQWVLAVRALTSVGQDLYAGIAAYPQSSGEPSYDGILRSTDQGASWHDIGLARETVFAIVATRGTLVVSATSGVYYTRDFGKTWIPDTSLGSPTISFCLKDSSLYAGTSAGIYRSTGQGTHWSHVGLSDMIVAIAASDTEIFAGGGLHYGQSVYRSTDNGLTWSIVGPKYSKTLALAKIGSKLVLSTYRDVPADVIFTSSDNGETWDSTLAEDCMAFAQSGSYLFAGTSGHSIFISTDTGQTWTNAAILDAGVTALAVSDNYLVAGTSSGELSRFAISDLIRARGVSETPAQQNKFSVYPNPFSQTTTISFTPESSGYTEISVVNLLGVEVARIFSGEVAAGEHTFIWDAAKMAAPRGLYECLVRMNGRVEKLPIMLTR